MISISTESESSVSDAPFPALASPSSNLVQPTSNIALSASATVAGAIDTVHTTPTASDGARPLEKSTDASERWYAVMVGSQVGIFQGWWVVNFFVSLRF